MTARSPETLSYCVSTSDGRILPPLDDEQNAELESAFRVGARIGRRYLLQSSLGRGGMGHVFLARDERLDRLVAMKVMAESQPGRREAMAKEARLGALLNHPGIATVFDFGMHASRFFTIFEYIEGLTLRDVLQRRRQLPLAEARQVVGELSRALDYANSNGVVHRDLKPENICLAKSGQLKILDLGVARDLRHDFEAQGFSGTPAYAAPEQAACGPTDGRTDQYALAVITYEMLAGRRPFASASPLLLLSMHQQDVPESLGRHGLQIPADAEAAIMRALEKEPGRRFATCQEYADAFGCHPTVPRTPLAALEVPQAQRISVYLCHVGSDSLVARRTAEALEQRGFSTWYYQRDALPGVSLHTQSVEAIRRSRAILLLISSDSLASADFAREIREAHQVSRPFLPVLVGLSLEEFVARQPTWRSTLGAAAVVELDPQRLSHTVARLASALETLGFQRDRESSRADQPPVRDVTGQVWATDANQIGINDLGRIVFKNAVIEDFLTRRSKCFISATKGLGKTLLLTYKRYLLTQSGGARDADESVCMIPEGRPYLDFMSEMKSLSKKYEVPLSDLNTTKRIWSAALRISLISHHPSVIADNEVRELAAFPERVQRWLRGSRIEPTVVFKELTRLSISQINQLIDETENFLDQSLRVVHGATFFFIDKVDQAIRQLPRAAWINVQAGLVEAAWEMMNANSHVKVFATIRQEAFANYGSDIKSNLYGATTILRYNEQELLELMDNLSRCYEGSAGFKDFIGLNVVKHGRRPLPEDSFQFVRRHTLGRPRDFVAIASELSANKSSLNEKRFCDLVRQTSASGLVANVFDEMRVFLDCLEDKATRLRFLAAIPANILSREEAIAVSAKFNGLPVESIQHYGEESGYLFHPFRDLYMCGLLGVIVSDAETGASIQKFRLPDDIVSDVALDLPVSRYYFIHPALSGFIAHHRRTDDYHVFQHVVVGENASWQSYDGIFCQLERHVASLPSLELRNEMGVVLREARSVLSSGTPRNLRMAIEATTEWNAIEQRLEAENHDEVLLWMEELLSCC